MNNRYKWLAAGCMLVAVAWFIAAAWHMQEMTTVWEGKTISARMTGRGARSWGPWSNGSYYKFSDGYTEFEATVTRDSHFADTVKPGWETTFYFASTGQNVFIHTCRSKWSFVGMFAADIVMMILFFRIAIDMIKRSRN